MRIVLSNYRYFTSGGPERYLFAIQEILEKKNHQIIPFSVQSSRNIPSQYEHYFLKPIGSTSSIYFNDYKKDIRTVFRILSRQFYSIEAFNRARRLIKDVKADIVYSLHFLNKMSPSVLDGFKSAGMPVVVRISDFGIICPQGHLFHRGKICELCLKKSMVQAIKHKCIMNSRTGSIIKACAWSLHRLLGCLDRINALVFPSKFTLNKFVEAGLDEKKFYHIPTFIDTENITPDFDSQNYLLYFGRLTEEKGVHLFIEAYNQLKGDKPQAIIIGDPFNTQYSKSLVDRYKNNVRFLKFMCQEKLGAFIKKAMAVVIPSVWYENMPNVLLESQAYGKPVIAPKHGCFEELVRHETTGLLYDPNNKNAICECLSWAFKNTLKLKAMGFAGRQFVVSQYSPEAHYSSLLKLFKNQIKS